METLNSLLALSVKKQKGFLSKKVKQIPTPLSDSGIHCHTITCSNKDINFINMKWVTDAQANNAHIQV